jgi:hypothetical protein
VRRVADFIVAPLRLISRPVALLTAALLLVGAWGLTAFLQTAQVMRDAVSGLAISASAVAVSIDVPLEHFAEITDSFRASDLQGDRVVLTGRLIRLQSAVPAAAATFAVGPSGQLLASSSPASAADSSVADTQWFGGSRHGHAAIAAASRFVAARRAVLVAGQDDTRWVRPSRPASLAPCCDRKN